MTPAELEAVSGLSDDQFAALTAYGEARNQPVVGIIGVLMVQSNRVQLAKQRSDVARLWGSTWSAICTAPEQFSCWNDNDPNRPELMTLAGLMRQKMAIIGNPVFDVCQFLATQAVAGILRDVTGGATHYYAPAIVSAPAWSSAPAVRTTVIAGHAFYKNVRV